MPKSAIIKWNIKKKLIRIANSIKTSMLRRNKINKFNSREIKMEIDGLINAKIELIA